MSFENKLSRRAAFGAIPAFFTGLASNEDKSVEASQQTADTFAPKTPEDQEMIDLAVMQTPLPASGFKTRLLIGIGLDKYPGGQIDVYMRKIGPAQISLNNVQTFSEGLQELAQEPEDTPESV